MKYNKLVRDKIPEIIRDRGKIPITHIGDDKEYWDRLKNKFKEEVGEFIQDENKEELADIFEVITAINYFKGWTIDDIIKIQNKKRKDKGGFKNKIILDEIKE
jgi:predicted house-cleaning noncanonical NTP pyrophosphatase (MazG superfamily)